MMAVIERGQQQPQHGLTRPSGDAPVAVVMRSSVLWQIPNLLEGLASAGLVLVLVIFMLLERRQMRDRLIRLIGYGRLAVTTRALDEAAARISRYLVAQSLLNAAYGFTVGAGLYFLGVPYALLWGFLAAVLRFIPYVGAFLGAAMPVTVSLAAFPGWAVPFKVAGLFAAAELVTNMIVEPLTYGQSAGVSQVALLAAVAFWTWLWGPIGLVLATPLTVCLVVLSKYVPELEFIVVLMGDEPVMEIDVRLYQRLLAMDQDEASELVEQCLREHPADEVYDAMLIPALGHARRDRAHGRLADEDWHFLVRATREIVLDLAGRSSRSRGSGAESSSRATDDALVRDAGVEEPETRLLVLGCPARDELDEIALEMFRQVTDGPRQTVEVLSSTMLSSEISEFVKRKEPVAVCIAALPWGGLSQARYLTKRLRASSPELKIAVGRWGLEAVNEDERRGLVESGANAVGFTLIESRDQLLGLLQSFTPRPKLDTKLQSEKLLAGVG
jgi:hypothetical protein